MPTMSPDAIEKAYAGLAHAIDKAGPDRESLMLTRLALLLAEQLGDTERFETALQDALEGLPTYGHST